MIKRPEENVDILTNREFVDKFENIDKRCDELVEDKKKLSQQISENKISILNKSKDLQESTDKEEKYIAKYQKLLVLHDKCNK